MAAPERGKPLTLADQLRRAVLKARLKREHIERQDRHRLSEYVPRHR